MKWIDTLAVVLVLIASLNCGAVGLFGINPAAVLLADSSFWTRVAYVLVGLAGLFQVLQWDAIRMRWLRRTRPFAS